uniref:Uncharacterized protein n=1 Tax=Solibacter usitatus (strain Ellin6076) TaxID=234267 RepID=Q01Z18_SOLUE
MTVWNIGIACASVALLGILSHGSIAYADMRIELFSVANLHASEDAGRIVAAIEHTRLGPPEDPWQEELLAASKGSFKSAFTSPVGELVGMATVKATEGDVFIANWETGGGGHGIRGFWAWDTPEHNWFVLQCDPAEFASAARAEGFLSEVLRFAFTPSTRLQLKYAPGETFLHGDGVIYARHRGGEYFVHGFRSGENAYLLVQVGKAPFMYHYPEGGAYVRERFPPLKALIEGWTKTRLLDEIDRTWQTRGPGMYNNARDRILLAAATTHGLNGADVKRLILSQKAPDAEALELRTSAVMRALLATHQVDRNREAIEEITLELGRRSEVGPGPVASILRSLESVEADYTDLALKCLKSCIYSDGPLSYLAKRGNTEETYSIVKAATVSRLADGMQRSALKAIRDRFDQAKNVR